MAYKLARGHTSGGHGHDQPVLSVSHEHALLEKLHHLAARCPRVAGLLLGSAHLQEAKRRQRARRMLGVPPPNLL